MRLIYLAIALALATAGFADTVTLKSGRVIHGTYLGGTARQLRVDTGDRVETLDVADVARIEFGDYAPAPTRSSSPASSDDERPRLRRAQPDSQPGSQPTILRPDSDPPPAQEAARRESVELPAGTNLVVRMIDGVDSDVNRVGQTFAASLDQPVTMGGETIIPRGADVVVKLVDAHQSGKLTGTAGLTLDLMSVKVDGRIVDIDTQSVSRESDSRGQKTAKVAGGGAVLGAIIGGIAGGGKGAVIGAGAGGAAGAGAESVSHGQRVKVPSETRLTFVLENSIRI
jgi:hypothetical protein